LGLLLVIKPKKTIIVAIQTRYQDPKYGKVLLKTKRYMAHDEENVCKSGDLVLLEETAPISRHKHWKLKKILTSYAL